MSNLYFAWNGSVLVINLSGANELLGYVRDFTDAFASASHVRKVESLNLSLSCLVCIREYDVCDPDFPYGYWNDEFIPCPDPAITDSWGRDDNVDEGRAIVRRDGVQWLHRIYGGHFEGDTDLTPIFPVSWLEAIAFNRPLPTTD